MTRCAAVWRASEMRERLQDFAEIVTAAAGRLADRKERFAGLNDFVRAQGGSIISLPGAREVVVEMLLESGLPSVLTDLGYDIRPDGEG